MTSGTDSPFKSDALQGHVVLVTGGGSGIGLEISRQLGLHGCKVAITGRRSAVLQAAEAELVKANVECIGIQGDVRSADDCRRAVSSVLAKWGRLSVLVNCAAGNFLTNPEELSVNGFRVVMEIDAVGTFSMSRAAFPALKDSCCGRIINISATLHYGATWFQVHASAAKAAVDSITRSLALEWGEFGIRVNAVAPGIVEDTAGLSKLGPNTYEKASIIETVPVGRLAKKRDIALACVFLASGAADYVSGHCLVVDGANWMWRPRSIPRELVSETSRGRESSRTDRQVGFSQSKM